MDYATFNQIILDSEMEDWLFDEGSGRATYRGDLSVSIIFPNDVQRRDFQEPWLNSCMDRRGEAQDYFCCYNGVPFERGMAVLADGARVIIPVPTMQLTIGQRGYKIGQVLNHFRIEFDQYLRQCGIRIV